MKFHFILALLIVAFVCQISKADVTYNLVDHGVPDHVLTGTITVLDSAADDGTLDESEIVSWQVAVSGLTNFDFSSADAGSDLTVSGVLITSTEIIVSERATTGQNLILYDFNAGSDFYIDTNAIAANGSSVGSVNYNDSVGGVASLPLANLDRVHAIRVPEPSIVSMIWIGMVGACLRRRRD